LHRLEIIGHQERQARLRREIRGSAFTGWQGPGDKSQNCATQCEANQVHKLVEI
jgi:hypothetical protein